MDSAPTERLTDLLGLVEVAKRQHEQLVLLTGPSGSGKTRLLRNAAADRGWLYANVGLTVAEAIAPLSKKDRALWVHEVLQSTLVGQEVVLLDNTELLFEPELQLDPIRLLRDVSKNVTVVASILGAIDGGNLLHGIRGQEDSRRVFPVSNPLSIQLSLG